MKTKNWFCARLAGGLMLISQITVFAQGTAFTYDGRLNDGGSPVTGIYDMRFAIYDANIAGNRIGGPVTNAPTGVTNGLFAVTMDFGAGIFTGPQRWLEIGVRTNGSANAYTVLSPRQQVMPLPYAIFAGSAASLPGFQVQPNATSPNLIGGYASNYVAPGVYGATIAGGGASGVENHINAIGGTIGGGANNQSGNGVAGHNYTTVAGGYGNVAIGDNSTVGGGINNQAAGANSGVSFGSVNYVGGDNSAIGGGANNVIQNSSSYSMIGGGSFNTNSGSYATIPGGDKNAATNNAFAAGHRAKANHQGSFVWADSTEADFSDTASNQFLVRANGGVGIWGPGTLGTAFQAKIQNGSQTLALGANSTAAEIQSQGGVPLYVNHGGNDVIMVDSGNGNVGIGTSTPGDQLDIFGGNRKVAINPAMSGAGGILSLSRPDDGNMSFAIGGGAAPNDDFVLYGSGGGGEMRLVSGGGGSTGFGFYLNTPTAAAFGSARPTNTIAVKIDGSGNVGLGTAAPHARMEINSPSSGVSGQEFLRLSYGPNDYNSISSFFNGNPGNSSLAFNVEYASGDIRPVMVLNGNAVGIGTGSPSATLDVNGSVKISGLLNGNTETLNQLVVNGTIYSDYMTDLGGADFGSDIGVGGSVRALNVYTSGYFWSLCGGGFSAYHRLGEDGGLPVWESSDKRLKRDIAPIPNALATVAKLRGVTWHWNETGLQHLTANIEKDWRSLSGTLADDEILWEEKRQEAYATLSQSQMGFVAQEVEKVFPGWVTTDPQGYKKVNMEHLNAVLVNAIKEQQEEIETQEKEIADLKVVELQKLKEQNEMLERQLNELQESIKSLAERK